MGCSRCRIGIAALAALACALSACGVSVDESPRPLQLPTTSTTVSPTPPTGAFETVLYYVAEGDLLPVVRDLPDRTLETILAALLDPPSGTPPGLGTSIPSGTTLLGLQRDRKTIAVNLSEPFQNVVGQSRQQAIGQIVLTVTELADIERVRFLIEGEPVSVSSPVRGDAELVDACDFRSMLASVGEAVDRFEHIPTAALIQLIDRIDELERECSPPLAPS